MVKRDPERIRQLIRDAKALLSQQGIDERTKQALAECLKSVQANEKMREQEETVV